MKKFFTLIAMGAFVLIGKKSQAQFSENFTNDITTLSGNCWQFSNGIAWTNTSPNITGGTIYGTTTGDATTPYLNMSSTSVTISFKYQLSNNLSGPAVRTIEIGLVDALGNYSSLQTISLNNASPTTVQTFSNVYTLSSTGVKKLKVTIGGSGGSVKLMIDDLSTTASAKYGPTNFCNSAPNLAKDTFFFSTGLPGYGNVMLNDVEPDGENMTAVVLTPSPDGVVIMNANGSFSFTPSVGFTGTTSNFVYQVCDDGIAPTCAATTVKLYFTAAAPLPVKLVKFQGTKNGDKVSLQWTVATNETVDRFEVERSVNGRDFMTAALVMTNDQTGDQSYAYHETVNSEAVYYRLKMIDKNQVSEYSKTLAFRSTLNSTNGIRIMNNPVNDKLTFSFSSTTSQAITIKVYDASGRTQVVEKQTVYAGSNVLSVSLDKGIKPGMYIMEITDGAKSQSAKFIKQ